MFRSIVSKSIGQCKQMSVATFATQNKPGSFKGKVNPNRYANAHVGTNPSKITQASLKKQDPKEAEAKKPNADMNDLFAKSRMNTIFNAPQLTPSYFSRLEDKELLYFTGSRRVITTDGKFNESNICFLVRGVDREQRVIADRLITFDYESNMPFEQELVTYVDEDMVKAHVIDRDEDTDTVVSRTFIKLRGEPWAWHSAVAMTRLEESDEYPDRPETMTISRLRFNENGMVAEKLIRQNNETLVTLVDDLKIITPTQFAAKTKKLFDEYSKKLSESMETAAEEFGKEEGDNAHTDGFMSPETRRK